MNRRNFLQAAVGAGLATPAVAASPYETVDGKPLSYGATSDALGFTHPLNQEQMTFFLGIDRMYKSDGKNWTTI